MASDILHFAQAFFLEFRVAHRHNLVHNQNLVCAYPKSQSPLGLPAAAYLSAPGASVQAPKCAATAKREPQIHPGAIQVDSLAPAHLTLRAALRQSPERLPRRLGHRRVDIPCTA